MKRVYLFMALLCLLTTYSATAQRLGDKGVEVIYFDLPDTPLPKEFTTYSTTLKGTSSNLTRYGISPNNLLGKHLKFEAFQRVDNGGHFNVEVNIGRISAISSTKSENKERKDKDGKVTKWKVYYKVVTLTAPISYLAKDKDGKVLVEGIASSEPQTLYYNAGATLTNDRKRAAEYESSKTLGTTWEKNGPKAINSGVSSFVNGEMWDITQILKKRYDYIRRTEKFQVLTVKKHDAEAGFDKNAELVAKAFEGFATAKPLSDIKDKVAPAFEFWKAAAQKYDAKDKKERKVVHAAHINLARVAYWLDMAESAKSYAEDAMKVDFKTGRAERLLERIQKLEKDLAANDVPDRHTAPDLSTATAPDSGFKGGFLDAAEAADAAARASADTAKGYIEDAKGDRYEGTFVFSDGSVDSPKFGIFKDCVKFEYEKNGEAVVSDLNPKSVKRFAFNGRDFGVVDDMFVGGSLLGTKDAIMEMVYHSDKISILNHIRYYDRSKIEDDEFVYIKKAGEKKGVSTLSAAFLLKPKKNLAKVYADCPSLSERILNGEFKNEVDDHIRAAKEYTENCK